MRITTKHTIKGVLSTHILHYTRYIYALIDLNVRVSFEGTAPSFSWSA